MQVQRHNVLTYHAQRTARQANLGALDLVASGLARIRDIGRADRPEELALVAGFGRHRQGEALEKFLATEKAPWVTLHEKDGKGNPVAEYYGIMAIPTVMLVDREGKVVSLRARGGDAVLETGPEGVEALWWNGRPIPLDRRGNLLVNYRGRRHRFPHISAAAILDGTADPAVLVAASRAGVAEIYKVGGAQAIAAMAYGTATIPKVRKIFGPGNPWVTSAKTIVSADPDGAAIDMPAGPSEVLVIADAVSSPEFVAADLLSQAEHGVDSQVVLVTTDAAQATSVQVEITRQLESLSRSDIAASALENSLFIVAPDVAAAIEISNRYAPEHLILQIENPRAALSAVRNAGSVFVGRWTPESVGDYCSGTNHVLPTYGYAATYSGLGVDQFLRQMTVQELTRDGLENLGAAVIRLAGLEGLDAHAAAVSRRLATKP